MAFTEASRCPNCGSPRPPSRLHGNCAGCLIDLASGAGDLEDVPTDTPRHVGGYELLGEIARGGMGVVYRARQAGLARDVALKLIGNGRLVRPEQVQRFYTEARAVARLEHPNIVPVYEAGEGDGRHFIAMKLLEGGTLAERMAGLPPMGSPERTRAAAGLVSTVARAVHFAHQHGVLHRDLKPANILFDQAGEPHVADFGLARLTDEDSRLTRTLAVLGTPDYLAPEVARGGAAEATVASDVFGLGAVLYELLCGTPPFTAATPLETLRRAADEQAIPPSRRLPTGSGPAPRPARLLDTVCLKCLAKAPAGRYASAAALADDLDRWLDGRAILARPETPLERVVRGCRQNPALAATLMALAAAILTGVAVAVSQANSNRLNLYAADLHIASEAVANGDLGLARELLARHRGATNDFAWRYLRMQADGDPLSLADVHPWIVNALAWSPDGRALLTGSVGSGTVGDEVHLVDIGSTRPPQTVGTNGARSLAWFPDGRSFLTANVDGRVRIWDTATRRLLEEFGGFTAALSGDGSRLVTCEGNPFPWEGTPAGPAFIRSPAASAAPIALPESRVVAISHDGRTVAVSDANTVVTLHDGATGRLLRTLPSSGRLWSLEFSPDGTRLAATGWDTDVRLWDLKSEDGQPARLKGHTLSTWKAAFSPDGRHIVSTSSDQTLRWWDVATGTPLGLFRGHGGEVWCAAFSPDGRQLASGGKDRTVVLWPAHPPDRDAPLPHHSPLRPVFTEDGGGLVTVTNHGMDSESLFHQFVDARVPVRGVHGSPLAVRADGRWLVHDDPGRLVWLRPDDPQSRVVVSLEPIPGAQPYVETAVSDNTLLFAGSDHGSVGVWRTDTGRLVARFSLPPSPTVEMALSRDGRWLAIAAEEAGAWLCPIRGGMPRHLTNHLDQVRSVAFSPDSTLLATASVDATINVWRLPSAEVVATLRGHRTTVDSVAFSPDGQILASLETGHSVRLWHLATRREAAVIPVPDGLDWLRFSPDGRHLGVLTAAGVRLLDAQ